MVRKGLVLAGIIAALFIASQLLAGEQDFTLINSTGVEIHELYISAHSTNEWEEDVLSVDTLPDGEEVTINFPHEEDECLWDMMVKDSEGNSITWQNIDLCQYASITLHFKDGKAWAECE